jgi:hypothetical protein
MACGALALTAPALAQAVESLAATGSIAYTWQAMAQLGCAKEGLCGVHGAVTFTVQDASYSTGTGFPPINIDVTATARTQGPTPGTSCVDELALSSLELGLGSRTFLSHDVYGAPSSGRCPGPLVSDLVRLPFPVGKHGRRHPSFDLRGIRTGSAGPYAIALHSTMTLHPGGLGGFSISSFGSGGGRLSRRGLVEEAVVRYRLARSTGGLVANFRAPAGPLCYSLGDCGASGSVSVSGLTSRTSLVVRGERVVRRRVGRAQVLSDLRAGRLFAGGQLSARVHVGESISGGGTASCSDTRSSPLFLQLAGGTRGSELDLFDDFGDVLRTYCPGPLSSDLLPAQVEVGQARFGTRELGARVINAELSLPPRLTSSVFSGGWDGKLGVSLVRVGLRAGTIRTRIP